MRPHLKCDPLLLSSSWASIFWIRGSFRSLSKAKHQNRIGYRAGIGAQYDFNENWAIRVMGRYTYLGMSRVNNLKEVTAGLKYTF